MVMTRKLKAVVEPVIFYVAGVWAPATNKLGIQKKLNGVQLVFALKLCRIYCTVSLNSPPLLAGIAGISTSASAKRVFSALRSPHPAYYVDLEFKCLGGPGAAHSQQWS
ncbi:unnamed protein product [Euphydryas editha]|uniref:Uncharacterized protein n=1 Tax=Euphydryas editha TaxID=104508 RepID=A0AAU9UI67_EUPED|nr:unnamed protein product [Euphydryas editha]